MRNSIKKDYPVILRISNSSLPPSLLYANVSVDITLQKQFIKNILPLLLNKPFGEEHNILKTFQTQIRASFVYCMEISNKK